ncbi:hypothetical protein J0X14_14325 [Muricauda sp. CAU 1633]|uniref:hypothetical protein n=1 Tax=Allomuricauda sp. CAU 1633 TaxID=2816036 RepID=UPI001A8C6487|nr:hypothetical protein [Muricauda sp. CAU 1633]MBO0323481.1 hypothetical protein [Muricauda sp. CAU 1633]
MENKFYGIYQFLVEARNKESKLLVGKVVAQSEESAIDVFLDLGNPSKEQREFIKGYLSAIETDEEGFKLEQKEEIKKNAKRLGVWNL